MQPGENVSGDISKHYYLDKAVDCFGKTDAWFKAKKILKTAIPEKVTRREIDKILAITATISDFFFEVEAGRVYDWLERNPW